jgi:hypothetical protein
LVDQKLLEASLKLAHCSRMNIVFESVASGCYTGCGNDLFGDVVVGLRCFNCLDRAWELVLHGSRLWNDGHLIKDRNLDPEFKLGLRSTVELLVDGSVAWVESHKGGGAVRVALEHDLG